MPKLHDACHKYSHTSWAARRCPGLYNSPAPCPLPPPLPSPLHPLSPPSPSPVGAPPQFQPLHDLLRLPAPRPPAPRPSVISSYLLGIPPESQIPQKTPKIQNKKTLKNASNLPPRYVYPQNLESRINTVSTPRRSTPTILTHRRPVSGRLRPFCSFSSVYNLKTVRMHRDRDRQTIDIDIGVAALRLLKKLEQWYFCEKSQLA